MYKRQPFNQLQIFAKCASDCIQDDLLWNLLDGTRTFLQNVINPASFSTWFPTLQTEFRIVNISADTLVLEHLSPGKWVSFEIVNIQEQTIYANKHLTYFYQLEQVWKSKAVYGYSVHHGKSFGTGVYTAPSGAALSQYYAFQDTARTQNVYSASVRSAFLAAMSNYDPTGVFRAGFALEMLNHPSGFVTSDPRRPMGMRCLSGNSRECRDSSAICLANTCQTSPVCSIFFPCPSSNHVCDVGICREKQLPYAQPCSRNSQCASNICCAGFCSNAQAGKLNAGAFCTGSCQCKSGVCFIAFCT